MKGLRVHAPLLAGIGGIFLLVFLTQNTDIAANGMKKGVYLIENVLLPSLFPLLVVSDLLLRIGAFRRLQTLTAPLGKVLGFSPTGSTALCLGWLLGTPIGVCQATADLESGFLCETEHRRIVCLTANPGMGFLVGVVGVGIFGSQALGWMLYTATVLSAALLAFLWHISGKKRPQQVKTPPNVARKSNISTVFTESVKGSMSTFLHIAAFVLVFSVLTAYLYSFTVFFNLPPTLTALLSGLFELTTGVMQATALTAQVACDWIAFFTGFAGLSICLQVLSLARGYAPPCPLFLGVKCLQGILTAGLMRLMIALWHPHITYAKPILQTLAGLTVRTPQWGNWLFLFLALFLFLYRVVTKPLVYFYKTKKRPMPLVKNKKGER